jgi:putative glycerol-1-phosphate prenyltransferase
LISGRNPDYLIEHQVKAAITKRLNLRLSTGYMLIAKWSPYRCRAGESNIPLAEKIMIMHATAQAGEMLGNKLIYLEAGAAPKNQFL